MVRMTLTELRKIAAGNPRMASQIEALEESQKRGRRRHAEALRAVAASVQRIDLRGRPPVEFIVPVEVITENRTRAMQPIHRRRHEKAQRSVLRNAWLLHFHGETAALPVSVTFTRLGRRMDSHDSLAAAFKHLTDEVTLLLGLTNDDTAEVQWVYGQEPSTVKAFRLTIAALAAPQTSGPATNPYTAESISSER